MKRIYYIILGVWGLMTLLSTPAAATNTYGKVQTKLHAMEIEGDSLKIHFDILLKEYALPPSYQLTLLPVLNDEEGNQTLLQGVLVEGTRRKKLNKRLASLGKADGEVSHYETLTVTRHPRNYTVNYSVSVPFERWMLNARLYVWGDECGCGVNSPVFDQTLVGYMKQPEVLFKPEVTFLVPEKEIVKSREETGVAYLLFPVDGFSILPEKGNNAAELRKISEMLTDVKSVPGVEIHNVLIRAYASPDGPFYPNLELSEKRAAALKTYISKNYGLAAGDIKALGFGEDWGGLVERIKDDEHMPMRDEVLAIIHGVDIFEGRESKLMALDDGRPYRYMLQTHYPPLRRSEYVISYTVPGFNLADAKALLRTKPALLSLEEMYQIANSYDKGSVEFNELFDIAARVYPADKIAQLNAAAAALLKSDTVYAAEVLEQYTEDADAWTNLGALRTLQGRLDEAKVYFTKARNNGVKEAQLNLEQIEKVGAYGKIILTTP